MSYQQGLSHWCQEVSSQLPHLSRPQAYVLACWSYAMIFVHSSGITRAAYWLSLMQGGCAQNWRQRLREWCYDGPDKKGSSRDELSVVSCFPPLLRWVVRWWSPHEKRLALVLDASTLGDRFIVLAVSVVYRGCAIPVAWQLLAAKEQGSWEPIWLDLLTILADSIPADWMVLVLTDRGLYARWLFEGIRQCGWHPMMRLREQGLVRCLGQDHYVPLASLLPVAGKVWAGEVCCFEDKQARVQATLLGARAVGYREGWLLLTDLSPQLACAAWYQMRFWIERGFKSLKRGGWQWHESQMRHVRRAERQWLVMAVATLWLVSVGGEADATVSESHLTHLPSTHVARRKHRGRPRRRELSCLTQGQLQVLAALLKGQPVPMGQLVAHPWPELLPVPRKLSRWWKKRRKKSVAKKHRWEQGYRARKRAAKKNLPV